jgi:hypothetical protein
LNHDGNRRYHDERLDLAGHLHLLTTKRTCHAGYKSYETYDSRLYVSFTRFDCGRRPSFCRASFCCVRLDLRRAPRLAGLHCIIRALHRPCQ